MSPALQLPPLQDPPASLTPRPLQPAVSPLLHQSSMAVHGISGSEAELHGALQRGMHRQRCFGDDVCGCRFG